MITGAAQMDGADVGGFSCGWSDASDSRACVVGASGERALHRGVFEQSATWLTTRSCWIWWSWRYASCCRRTSFLVTTFRLIRGSALKALESDDVDSDEVKSIFELMSKRWIHYIPVPERDVDRDFLMPIEDIFSISGRGTVVTGRVDRGIVNVGDEIEIVGIRDDVEDGCHGCGDVSQVVGPGSGRGQHRGIACVARRRTRWSVVRCWRSRVRSRLTRSSRVRCIS